VVQVIRSRSSSSIYLPMCIANLVNTLLWIGYGFVSALSAAVEPSGSRV
jgi:uncharacterized protein with PQ loop repeat